MPPCVRLWPSRSLHSPAKYQRHISDSRASKSARRNAWSSTPHAVHPCVFPRHGQAVVVLPGCSGPMFVNRTSSPLRGSRNRACFHAVAPSDGMRVGIGILALAA